MNLCKIKTIINIWLWWHIYAIVIVAVIKMENACSKNCVVYICAETNIQKHYRISKLIILGRYLICNNKAQITCQILIYVGNVK